MGNISQYNTFYHKYNKYNKYMTCIIIYNIYNILVLYQILYKTTTYNAS